jgi:hypothetical protein
VAGDEVAVGGEMLRQVPLRDSSKEIRLVGTARIGVGVVVSVIGPPLVSIGPTLDV